jgi:hypothetical protein
MQKTRTNNDKRFAVASLLLLGLGFLLLLLHCGELDGACRMTQCWHHLAKPVARNGLIRRDIHVSLVEGHSQRLSDRQRLVEPLILQIHRSANSQTDHLASLSIALDDTNKT